MDFSCPRHDNNFWFASTSLHSNAAAVDDAAAMSSRLSMALIAICSDSAFRSYHIISFSQSTVLLAGHSVIDSTSKVLKPNFSMHRGANSPVRMPLDYRGWRVAGVEDDDLWKITRLNHSGTRGSSRRRLCSVAEYGVDSIDDPFCHFAAT